MSFSHGSRAVVVLNGTNTSIYVTSVTLNTERDEASVTAMGASYQNFLGGAQDATLELEGIYDPTLDALMYTIGALTTFTWEFYPQGQVSGTPAFSGTAIRLNYDVPASVDDAVTWSATIHIKTITAEIQL